ncbi:MAG TPA: hypothetical protein VGB14_08905 [Acidimicrobiales bacterium]
MRPFPSPQRRLPGAALVAAVLVGLLAAPAGATARVGVVRSPGAGLGARLYGVAFGSPSSGWAVGSRGRTLEGPTELDVLIQRWDGARWTTVTTEAVASSDEALTGVAALSATDAWAVGWQDRYGYNADLPILLHWDGATWSPVTGAMATGRLWSVAASGPDDVWALGTQLQHWDGRSWSVVPLADVAAAHAYTAVAASSPTDAWVVGSTFIGTYGSRGQTLVQHWDGSSWSVVPTATTDLDDRLTAVGAAGGRAWAVGSSSGQALAMRWDGRSWRRAALPATAGAAGLAGVTVAADGTAWAVGHHDAHDANGWAVWHTLVERFDGRAWRIVDSPNPAVGESWFQAAGAVGTTAWLVGADRDALVARAVA